MEKFHFSVPDGVQNVHPKDASFGLIRFIDLKHISHVVQRQPYKLLTLDCPLSKGNQAPHLKFERPNGQISESKYFLPGPRIGASSSLESSMKRFLQRFDSN